VHHHGKSLRDWERGVICRADRITGSAFFNRIRGILHRQLVLLAGNAVTAEILGLVQGLVGGPVETFRIFMLRETRKPGLETLFLEDTGAGFELERDSPALHLLQHIRDESHRFAIMGHRQQRDRKRTRSVLEDIPGVGPKRRKELLTHFGGMQGLARASQQEIENVAGINKKIAEDVYAALHNV